MVVRFVAVQNSGGRLRSFPRESSGGMRCEVLRQGAAPWAAYFGGTAMSGSSLLKPPEQKQAV